MRAVLPRVVLAFVLGALARPAAAQPLFTAAFPPEEFAARRARVMAAVGDGVAVLQGAAELPSYLVVPAEQPRLLPDRRRGAARDRPDRRAGEAHHAVPAAARRAAWSAPKGRSSCRATRRCVSPASRPSCRATTSPPRWTPSRAEGRPIYTPHRGESLGAFTPWSVNRHERLSSADPWDGRPSREAAFIARIKARAPQAKVEDLDPILDRMRLIKSPREIAAIREATRIAVGRHPRRR